MDQQLFINSNTYELDESKEYPYCYRTISEQTPDLATGDAIFLDTSDCHICVDRNGIQFMSDGKITNYLNREFAHIDVNHENYDVEEAGTLAEMGKKEYPLLSGTMSVSEGADLVARYFGQKDLFP